MRYLAERTGKGLMLWGLSNKGELKLQPPAIAPAPGKGGVHILLKGGHYNLLVEEGLVQKNGEISMNSSKTVLKNPSELSSQPVTSPTPTRPSLQSFPSSSTSSSLSLSSGNSALSGMVGSTFSTSSSSFSTDPSSSAKVISALSSLSPNSHSSLVQFAATEARKKHRRSKDPDVIMEEEQGEGDKVSSSSKEGDSKVINHNRFGTNKPSRLFNHTASSMNKALPTTPAKTNRKTPSNSSYRGKAN